MKNPILILLFCSLVFLTFSCNPNNYPRLQELIVADSLDVNLAFFNKKFSKFLKSSESQSLEKLWLADGKGWMMYSYYQLEGETHLRAVNPEKSPGWVEPLPLIQNIGNLKNLRVLGLSTLGLKELPESLTLLTQLEDLDIGFNDKLDWDDVIPKLKQLPNLKILRVYGMHVNQEILQKLKDIKENLEIRYSLEHFKTDMEKRFKTDTYRAGE